MMKTNCDPQWLDWTLRLQAIAQTGRTSAQDPFDIERNQAVRGLAAEIPFEHHRHPQSPTDFD